MSFNYACDWKSGFVMDPNRKQRVGYLVQFQGLNMQDFLKPDIDVFTPYNSAEASYGEVTLEQETGKITVVGVLDSFSWGGAVGDGLCFGAYISAENAEVLSAKTKTTLDTNVVNQLAWWIVNFDEENKVWFEECHPLEPTVVQGQINAPPGGSVALHVSPEPTKVASNIDINVYNVYFEVIPAANETFALHFATSLKTKFVKNWGLKIGTNAAAAVS